MSRYRRKRPRKSLSTLVMLWLLLFSVVPLAFITGYFLIKYEKAIDQELYHRLVANHRELESILKEYNRYLIKDIRDLSKNEILKYHLKRNEYELSIQFIQKWMASSPLIHEVVLFNSKGRVLSTVYRDQNGSLKEIKNVNPSYISEEFIKSMGNKKETSVVDIQTGDSLDLSAFSKIVMQDGTLLGHVKEVIYIDRKFLEEINERLGLEIAFFKKNIDEAFASNKKLLSYRSQFFLDKISKDGVNSFTINILNEPFSFMAWSMNWGEDQIIVSIGASKKSYQEVLKNVKHAFFGVIGVIIFLLIGLGFVISRLLLKPLLDLVDAVQTMDPDKELIQLPVHSDSEIGLLKESFNSMFKRVHQSQRQLKESIEELEKANTEIKEAQSKIVHASKMASLGQLVAGIAHELNNPIGFIHSNIHNLKEYYEKLIRIIEQTRKHPERFKEIEEKNELNYIVKDMPNLIKSCEEGTHRSRNIILGLRNFSRLDEAIFKEVNIHQGIESTLNLLAGELKNRIKVKKYFGKIPHIRCYPSQLNQVFMNILSNAAQAIQGEGTIEIATKQVGNHVEITIKDSGSGMSPQTVEHIFDPFFTTKNPGAGTGLGLSISYGIVQEHGGHIHVTSKLGRGTQFTISLPTITINQKILKRFTNH